MDYTPAQQKLIEKHRDINAWDGWHDSVLDDFRTVAARFGIDIRDIYYSGFWSQGDGACFTTRTVSLDDILKSGRADGEGGYPEDAGEVVASFRRLHDMVYDHIGRHRLLHPEGLRVAENTRFHVYHQGHYYHCNTMYLETDESPDEDDVAACVDLDVEHFEGCLRDHLRECANALYDALETEYEYQTSDEQVWDSIVANELDKEEAEDEDE